MTEQDVIETHYTQLAEQYNEFLYYSPQFIRALTSKMIDMLRLREDDKFVDLGCGTGMYSLDILEQVPLRNPIVCVDPFNQMLDQIPESSPVEKYAEGALSFSGRPGRYDKVLMKEAVHHIDDRARLFTNLHDRLTDNGVLLLVHVPPKLDYPLFRAALDRCEHWLADPDELTSTLESCGFRVERDAVDYRHTIPRDHYFRMVCERYMSVLSTFSDDDLEEGITEMERTYGENDVLEFTDHFDYLAASKT